MPVAYIRPVSVSGKLQDFLIVGIYARASLIMANSIEILKLWVKTYKIKANKEIIPQNISKEFIFQYPFFFKIAMMITTREVNPAINIGKIESPAPALN